MRASLKSLVAGTATQSSPEPMPPAPQTGRDNTPQSRQAQTRAGTRAVGGHFKPEVAHTLRVLAAEQDREHQELLAEALNMLFERYGKPTRAEVTPGRRKRDD